MKDKKTNAYSCTTSWPVRYPCGSHSSRILLYRSFLFFLSPCLLFRSNTDDIIDRWSCRHKSYLFVVLDSSSPHRYNILTRVLNFVVCSTLINIYCLYDVLNVVRISIYHRRRKHLTMTKNRCCCCCIRRCLITNPITSRYRFYIKVIIVRPFVERLVTTCNILKHQHT